MEKPFRVNLGSGRHPWPGFVNVDAEHGDVLSDVENLPFDDGAVDEIHAIHLFEHLDRMKIFDILAEWSRTLKDDGVMYLEMPCMDKIAQMVVDGEKDMRMTLFGVFGDIRDPNPYMRHKWCYTKHEIQEVMKKAGYSAEVVEPVFHFKERDMRVIARRL